MPLLSSKASRIEEATGAPLRFLHWSVLEARTHLNDYILIIPTIIIIVISIINIIIGINK